MSTVTDHFTARAAHYDRSSRWCTDPELAQATLAALQPAHDHRLLDVACGTGLVSAQLRGHVAHITGLDLTPAMFDQARKHVNELVAGPAEDMPFPDDQFDLVVCRQGIQFMDDDAAVREMVRVVKPGGRVVLVHLCAYGPDDRDEYFQILRLRNPARRNFYLREDLIRLLTDAGCRRVEMHTHISDEDVDVWSDNKAITEDARQGIRDVYRDASAPFRQRHAVRIGDAIHDKMLFGIAIGTK